MKVSGIVPCHNHAEWVNEAVDSMIAQTHKVHQIVVIDDGSTDGSAERVKGRLRNLQTKPDSVPTVSLGQLEHASVLVVELPKSHGPSFARNYGIRAAWEDTDVFALLDSDDIYDPKKVEKSVSIMEADSNVGAVYSDFTTFNSSGTVSRQYKPAFAREYLLKGECVVNCDSLVSKQALASCGLFDENMRVCEDYDLWMRISEKMLIVHIAESLVRIRVGDHSATSTVKKEMWNQCYSRVFQKLKERQKVETKG